MAVNGGNMRLTYKASSKAKALTEFVRAFRFFARYELVASLGASRRIYSTVLTVLTVLTMRNFLAWSGAFPKRNSEGLAVVNDRIGFG